MAQQYYFFKTVKIGGRQRLRPLPGQKEPSGRHIDEGLNVQADSRMREDYPLGTVFGSESLELRSLHSTTFYSAGAIYPIGLNLGDYHSQSHMPSNGMNEAYESYKADIEDKARPVLSGESTLFTENGNAATPGTLLAQIKADRKMNAPTIEDEGFHIADKDWYLLVRNIKSKVNTMMVGPSGTGKTELYCLHAGSSDSSVTYTTWVRCTIRYRDCSECIDSRRAVSRYSTTRSSRRTSRSLE